MEWGEMLTSIEVKQRDLLQLRASKDAKALGQFFTSARVAEYMASLLEVNPNTPALRILDAGAGMGILTIAAACHCLSEGCKQIHTVLYEIDESLLTDLQQNMDAVARLFESKGASFTYDIRSKDFILDRPDYSDPPYDISSINPPYFKYSSKESPYSGATRDLFKGDPNIYASFMAVVAECLAPGGQMVAIVPRSFTNGLYFKGFRWFLSQKMNIDFIHTFRTRNRVFREMAVLQENIICRFTKNKQVSETVVRTSFCSDDLDKAESNIYPSSLIREANNGHHLIRIPESSADGDVLRAVERWKGSLNKNGYFISTGPVVEHRTRDLILERSVDNSIPLLRMHNVKPFRVEWTGTHKKDACFLLAQAHMKHTREAKVYVVLKRFSSKDEERRLVAGVFDPSRFQSEFVAFENHLNYIGLVSGELCLVEACGIAGLFNSSLMDRYFRCVSGSTQVNATEIRLLKLPTRQEIMAIGSAFVETTPLNQEDVDRVVEQAIGVKYELYERLLANA